MKISSVQFLSYSIYYLDGLFIQNFSFLLPVLLFLILEAYSLFDSIMGWVLGHRDPEVQARIFDNVLQITFFCLFILIEHFGKFARPI